LNGDVVDMDIATSENVLEVNGERRQGLTVRR
jgi:hypothetical protein